jgi:hypothetical protein
MTYLEEAAAELRKARDANDRKAADPDRFDRASRAEAVRAERLRIAAGFERLAAIERGLPPCSCHEPSTAGAEPLAELESRAS